ncbi:hypothetical protein F443_12829 [Phytophthora nicotianae P1569]|uniref:Uncharacterized protein n=1 Tax=Phytophthora nicotianae P1569 TaxID=1317065 RepID=V9EU25_PHYNI|nr:hypothetical protein F443_12829 [Phytophthora nicotianae P1569]
MASDDELARIWYMLRSSWLPKTRQWMYMCAYFYIERPMIPAVVFRLDNYPG